MLLLVLLLPVIQQPVAPGHPVLLTVERIVITTLPAQSASISTSAAVAWLHILHSSALH